MHVFTDGSTINNGKKNSKGGVGVFFPSKKKFNLSQPFYIKPITNIRTELYAVISAIMIYTNYISKKGSLIIYTDCEYVINSVNKWINIWKKNNWKTIQGKKVKNKDLIECLYLLIKHYKNIKFKFVHIKAHKEPPKNKNSTQYKLWYGNYFADKLSKLSYNN